MTNDLTRPIIGIKNRTAQEVFDIMCARLAAYLSALGEQKTVAWIGPQSWETLQRDGRVQTEIAKEEFMGPRRKRWVALYASTLPVRPITDEDVERAAKAILREMETNRSAFPDTRDLARAALEAAGGRR